MKNIFQILTSLFLAVALHAQPSLDTTHVELPTQRTHFSKTFYSSRDNTFTTHLSANYIHYLDSDGAYRDIDTQLRQDSTGAFVTGPGLYRLTFPDSRGQQNKYDAIWEVPRPVRAKNRPPNAPPLPPAELRWKMLSYGYFDRLSYIYQTLENAAATTPFVSGNEINYPQLFHGVTVRFTCMNGRLKEEIVFSQTARDSLRSPSRYGLSPNDTYLMFAAEIDLQPSNIKAMVRTPTGKTPIKNGNRFVFNGTNPIDFEDAQENLYFSLPNDYAWAANDSTEENIIPVLRVFTTQQGKHYLYFGVPWTWVNTAPAGPLIIDPTVTLDDNLDDVTRDTRLQSATNYGTDVSLMAGKRVGAGKKRSLLKFDFAYSGIPSNATILNSQLNLYYYSAVASSGVPWLDRWVQAHQVLKTWDELQVTRDNRLTGTAWAAQYAALDGTDASATMESNMLFQDNQTGTWKVWNLTSLTQKWINGTAANNGVILWATNEDVDAYDLRFYSRENATNQPKLVVTWSNTPKTVYFLKDHLGSVRVTVDQTGTVVGYDDYDPWGYALAGRIMATQWTTLQAVAMNKFTGKERDDNFGINWDYFGARYYDAQIGRWMVLDPRLTDYPSFSPYVYVANNPLNATDPDGEGINFLVGGLIGGAVDFSLQVAGNLAQGQSFSNAVQNVNYAQVGISVVAGAASSGLSVATEGLAAARTINVIGSATIGAIEGAAKSSVNGQEITVSSVATDAIIGSVGGALSSAGQQVAQSTTTARELAGEAQRLTNIANTGRPRAAQSARAEVAQVAAQNYGSGTVATAASGVATGVVGKAANSATQSPGTTSVTANTVSSTRGVANSDKTNVVVKVRNEETKKQR